MVPHLDLLAQLCRDHPLREKIVVVPSLALGHQIGDALARSAGPWVNLRFETIRTIADAVAGFELLASGRTLLSRAQALAIIERACDEVLDSTSYFAAIADRPGFHRAVQRSIDDLRLAGVDRHAFDPAFFGDPRKGQDLRLIFESYQKQLEREGFVDRCGVLMAAIAMMKSGSARPWALDAVWSIVSEREPAALESELLQLVAPEAVTIVPADGGRVERPASFFAAAGEENEIRGVLRRITGGASPVSFDACEIVYTDRRTYLPLAYELTSEYGIPCTFAEGVPVPYTRPGQAVLGLLQWIGDGWAVSHLADIARSGALKVRDDDAGLSGLSFARLLHDAAIGWGRERHLSRLDVWIASRDAAARAEEDDERSARDLAAAERGRAARRFLVTLLDTTAAVTDTSCDLSLLAGALGRLVRDVAMVANEIDAMAREAILRTMEELAALPRVALPTSAAACLRLRDAVLRLHAAASNPRPGHLHVGGVRGSGWSGRSHLFVTGLDEARHPAGGFEDPVLLDTERGAINSAIAPRRLKLRGEETLRTQEDLNRLLARVASGSTLTMSFAMFDLITRRDREPSPALLTAYRSSGPPARRSASYDDLTRELSTALEGFAGATSLSETEWWLAVSRSHPAGALQSRMHAAYPWLASGAEAVAARETDEWTAWDGVVGPHESLDPRVNGRIYSASQLEQMAKCPFQYFLSRVLRVQPPEETVRDPDVWLDALSFGSLLHEVLELFMRALREEGLRATLAELPLLKRFASEELAKWKELVPPPNTSSVTRATRDLEEACEIFLRVEETDTAVEPRFFELRFGEPAASGDLPMPEPLLIKVRGGAVRVRGRIDRIDHDRTTNRWNIWDYKSGRAQDYSQGVFAGGRRLQPAIYSRAVAEMLSRHGLDGGIGRSGYFFPTRKGRGVRLEQQSGPGELERIVETLADLSSAGFFVQRPSSACDWCDHASICGDIEAMKQRDASKNAITDTAAAWLRLQGEK